MAPVGEPLGEAAVVVAVGGSRAVNQTPNRRHVAPIAAWLTDKLARAADAAHLSDPTPLTPFIHVCSPALVSVCLEVFILRLMCSFKRGRKEERSAEEGAAVAAVFGFMTPCSGIRVTAACVIAL